MQLSKHLGIRGKLILMTGLPTLFLVIFSLSFYTRSISQLLDVPGLLPALSDDRHIARQAKAYGQ